MDFAIGLRIADTRKRAGVALDDLARQARVPADALVALESGRPADVSTAAIARMARVLDVDMSDWVGPDVQPSEPSLFFRQAGVPDFFDADRGSVVKALRDARSIATVDELLGRKYRRREFAPVDVASIPYEQGYELARRVRRSIRLPNETIESVGAVIEDEFGVPVLASAFRAGRLFAMTAKERVSNNAVVIVNSTFSSRSRRVDLAHELAHVLFDEPRQDFDYWLDFETDGDRSTSPIEQRAKAFAAELLIPREGLVRSFGPPGDHVQTRRSVAESMDLARRVGDLFNTPHELTTYHLANNDYIDRSIEEDVRKSFVRVPRSEPLRVPMLHRRLAEALAVNMITQMRARELLGLSARDPLPIDVAPSV